MGSTSLVSMVGERPAVCHRCGARKNGPLVPCKACNFVPLREARAVAWLFSSHHLDEAELVEAERRIRIGDVPEPSKALRAMAQRAMGALDAPPIEDQPLRPLAVLLLVVTEVLLTPLVGVALWLGLRETRPRAARLVARITVPITAILVVLWMADRLHAIG